jgi:hypothetical protein
MTDNEIIKAFEDMLKNFDGEVVEFMAISSAIDLINRQQERIKTLTNSRDNWRRIAEDFDKASRETEKEVEGLQAEIERLTSCVKSEDEVRAIMKAQMTPMIKEITNEQIDRATKFGGKTAILEFAERLKENKIDIDVSFGYGKEVYTEAVAVIEIDNLVKEMVGENNGT